jgi:hypothetical protein
MEKFRLELEMLRKHGTGYVPDKRYNENFSEQGLVCPYEHCIEMMPLHEEEERRAVELEYFAVLTNNGWISCDSSTPGAMPDLNRYIEEFGIDPKSCGLFGHDCPGGKKQVNKCRSEGIF